MILTRETAAARRRRYARFTNPESLADPLRNPELASTTQRTKRTVALLLLTLLVPGGAQTVTGNKTLGRFGLRVTLTVWTIILVVLALALINRTWLIYLAANPITQIVVSIGLAFLGLVWLILWVDTFRRTKFHLVAPGIRPVLAGLMVILMVLTSGAMFYGAWMVNSSRSSLGSIFSSRPAIDPVDGRYNFLIMGVDADEGRIGIRPDSISVASINADTGSTVLFSIPRNFQNTRFSAGSPLWSVYPNGYSCGDSCIINALYSDVTNQHPELYPGAEDPGAEAMMDAASGILGLEVQAYVMVDMGGFSQLIDAMGGVTVTSGGWTVHRGVRPDGNWGNAWWEPGTHTLNGDDALAFARSRTYSSDYSRIRRQQCIQQAMIQQFDVPTLLTRFEGILNAGEQIVETDLPGQQLGTFVSLGAKTQNHPMQRLTIGAPDFGDQGDRFSTYPDYDQIDARVQSMLSEDGTPVSGVVLAPILQIQPRFDIEGDEPTGVEETTNVQSNDPADWPDVPTQPNGEPINHKYLMRVEDAGQVGLLEEASKTNHYCRPG